VRRRSGAVEPSSASWGTVVFLSFMIAAEFVFFHVRGRDVEATSRPPLHLVVSKFRKGEWQL
jgi:hypothetical protein